MLEISSIADTLAAMARQGGGTLDLATGAAATRESGYYVGGAHGILPWLFPSDPGMARTLNETGQWSDAVASLAGQGAAYVGVWEDSGLYYVDATEWHAEEWDALEVGRARGEIAVWDIAKGTEITC